LSCLFDQQAQPGAHVQRIDHSHRGPPAKLHGCLGCHCCDRIKPPGHHHNQNVVVGKAKGRVLQDKIFS
jgi:hypothetical protein